MEKENKKKTTPKETVIGCLGLIIIVAVIVIVIVILTNNDDKKDTINPEVTMPAQTTNNETSTEKPSNVIESAPPTSLIRTFNVNTKITSGPMTMNISEIILDPYYKQSEYQDPINAIILVVNIANVSTDQIEWYVSQDPIVLNTKEQIDESIFDYSDDVDGLFMSQAVKEGKIVFESKSDLSKVNTITYGVAEPFEPESLDDVGEATETLIELK